jgi:NDP-sugar pyrophosphorylase family protein
MAGGEGSRLRPVTCDTPKPMVRLCGRPVIEYILDLLAQHGFTQASVTLRYLPGRLSGHFGEQYNDITLTFIEEPQPLGTAGSVKSSCGPKDEEILVISSDREIASFAVRRGKATLSSPEFESIVERLLMASGNEFVDEKDEEDDEASRTISKKGPSRRLSRAEKQARAKIRKL